MKKSCFLAAGLLFSCAAYATPDLPFIQAVSVKYTVPAGLQMIKVITDYNDNVHVLTTQGFYRVSGNELVKDLRFRPLAQKIPVDVTTQETSGHLYYLYPDKCLTNGYAGIPYINLPTGKFNKVVVDEKGRMLLAGNNALALATGKELKDLPFVDGIRKLQVYKGTFYLLTNNAVYRFDESRFVPVHKVKEVTDFAFKGDDIVLSTSYGYYTVNRQSGDSSTSLQTRVPVPDIRNLLVVNDHVWAGTPEGAFAEADKGTYRYYASRRWIDQDTVKSMAAVSNGDVYILTPTGLNKIAFIKHTLAEKAAFFERKIRERHIRYGFIANVHLNPPGDVGSAEMADTDNDGLWSSFYLGSQAFRYATTHDPVAKRYAWETWEAFERILSVNQIKGFPARTFERKGYKNSDPERWRESPDPEWEWKGHTSSDEFVGHIWSAAVTYEMVAETPEEKQRVTDFVDKIMTHIIDHKYTLVDIDNKPTLWARWNPEYINWYPTTIGDRRLGSTTIMAGLQLAYKLTGKEKYKTEAFKLINKYGYLKNIMIDYRTIKPTAGYFHQGIDMGSDSWNHSDDEMAFLTYWVLYRYAFNDELKAKYKEAIRNHWEIEKPEKNAVWNLITMATAGDFDADATMWWLKGFPMDLITWKITNSRRHDITLLPHNFRNQTTEVLLPLDEQPVHRHNANAFTLDGGRNGESELAGDEFLLPYWMARYLKVIE
ncbi:hypothetical protein J2T02_001839 [Chitinophaga terrae (ex Kim and Jung 2007)]|uniref:hypothetical protein n=1 Tax=Chitinophaga terrae (ex Kim and Jung 2007) TaxID=408074 RepID=UPI0027847B4D|nr:hypothetical protein [Chitinophaga terrae (ex Kim and Jung 2007)]MDQ0106728.1 hypothetical protein [Chitinophaga terrae (ex Kim and Jung 2007)]